MKIQLIDANDNSPTFDWHDIKLLVAEDVEPGTLIETLSASDLDSSVYGDVTYSLKGFGSEKFELDTKTGELRVSRSCLKGICLDHERQKMYSLTLEAMDGGGKVATANVIVEITDVNDHAPIFPVPEYRRFLEDGSLELLPPLRVHVSFR